MSMSSLQGKNLLFMGDSMAEGMEPFIKKESGYNVTSLHKRGSTVAYWNDNKKFNLLLKSKKWDVIVVSLGTNDLLIKRPNEEKYFQFNKKLSSIKADVYWAIPPVMPFKNSWMEEWIENPPPPIKKINCGSDFQRAKDGIHLTQNGYKKWSRCIMDSIF